MTPAEKIFLEKCLIRGHVNKADTVYTFGTINRRGQAQNQLAWHLLTNRWLRCVTRTRKANMSMNETGSSISLKLADLRKENATLRVRAYHMRGTAEVPHIKLAIAENERQQLELVEKFHLTKERGVV